MVRKYDVYVAPYSNDTTQTKKTKHTVVRGKSTDAVKAQAKKDNPRSVVHVFVHY